MASRPTNGDRPPPAELENERNEQKLHPAWQTFIRYCRELRYGELGRVVIQDGLPVLAEHVRQKVKFTN